jgi:hypothetical protein
MSSQDHDTAHELVRAAVHCLDQSFAKITHCAGQLSEDQIWWRPDPELNSVGNLLLHLAGNLRQWIIAGVGGSEDLRDRPAEFSAKGGRLKAELLSQLEETVDEARNVLLGAKAEEMLKERRIQGFTVSGWVAVLDSLTHFQGHTQEIIGLTRQRLGPAYQFHWRPQTPEEGAI